MKKARDAIAFWLFSFSNKYQAQETNNDHSSQASYVFHTLMRQITQNQSLYNHNKIRSHFCILFHSVLF